MNDYKKQDTKTLLLVLLLMANIIWAVIRWNKWQT